MRRLIPKLREIHTNKLCNISASIIARAKRCLVKYTILQPIFLSARSVDNSPWIKIRKTTINIFLHSRLFGKPSEA